MLKRLWFKEIPEIGFGKLFAHAIQANAVGNVKLGAFDQTDVQRLPQADLFSSRICRHHAQMGSNRSRVAMRRLCQTACVPKHSAEGSTVGYCTPHSVCQIRPFQAEISVRKLIPVNVKSLGDYILLKRIEADLS